MKRTGWLFLLIFTLILSSCSSSNEESASDTTKTQDVTITLTQKETCEKLANIICDGDIQALQNDFTYLDEMGKAVKEKNFQTQIMSFSKSCGSVVSLQTPYAQSYQGNVAVFQPVITQKQKFNLQVTFAGDKIAGIFFRPYQLPEETMKMDGIKQKEMDLKIATGGNIKGYLCTPEKGDKFPVVILLGGSGPSDHNETIGNQKPFYELAKELGKQGIATYRFDKRTLENTFTQTDTIQQEYIEDALSAIQLMQQQKQIDKQRIYVLGHSQGGYILPRLNEQTKDVAGYIFMAAPSRPIEDSMVEQLTYLAKLDGKVDAEEQKQLDEAETVRKLIKQIASSKHDDTLYLGMTRAYLMDLATYDPVKTAEKIQVPVLLCQGLRDYQVTKTDLKRWQQAFAEKANWTIRTYATANHAMSKGSEQPSPKDYNQEAGLDVTFVKDIVQFIK